MAASPKTAQQGRRTQARTPDTKSPPVFNLLGKIADKAGPIKNELLSTMFLLAFLFGGFIAGLTYKGVLPAQLGFFGMIVVFAVSAIFLFFHAYATLRGYQSTRQQELRLDTRNMRRRQFNTALPKFSQN